MIMKLKRHTSWVGFFLIAWMTLWCASADSATFREIGPRGNLSGTIAVSRSFPRLIVHLDEGMVNYSEDAGESWNSIPAPPQVYSCDLSASPWNRMELFVCNSSAVYYCDGFTGEWTDRSPPDYVPDADERQFLRADPSVPGRLVLFYSDGLDVPKLRESLDSGVSWHALTSPSGFFSAKGLVIPEPSGQSLMIQVQTEMSTTSTVYVAITDDLGETWRMHPTPDGYSIPYCHVSDGWIWMTNHEVYKRPWVGGEWQQIPTPVSVIYMEFLPGAPETILVKDNYRLYVSTDLGQTWVERHRFPHLTRSVFLTPDMWLVPTVHSLLKSTDQGNLFTPCYSGSQPIPISNISFDPFLPGRIYASSSNLWISDDNGTTWTLSDSFPQEGHDPVICHPIVAGRLYSNDRVDGIVTSTDHGVSWRLYGENCRENRLGDTAFVPGTHELLNVVKNIGMKRSVDDSTWTEFFKPENSFDRYAELVDIDPDHPSIWTVFLHFSACGTEVSYAYRSYDFGLTWTFLWSEYSILGVLARIPGSDDDFIGIDQNDYGTRLVRIHIDPFSSEFLEFSGSRNVLFLPSQPMDYIYSGYQSLYRSSPYKLWGTPIAFSESTVRQLTLDPSNPDRILCAGDSIFELILTDHDPPNLPVVSEVIPRYESIDFDVSIPDDAAGIKLYTGNAPGVYDACRIAGREELVTGSISLPANHGNQIWYRVSCFDADGNESEWTDEASVQVRSLPENKPRILLTGYLNTRIIQGMDRSGKIAVWTNDPQGIQDIIEVRVLNRGDQPVYTLYDDGTGVDPIAGDGLFVTVIDPIAMPSNHYRFQAVDSHGDRSDFGPTLSIIGESR